MPKVIKSYLCEVCGNEYRTSKEAVTCEKSHGEKSTIRETLIEIRVTSESFDELNKRASEALKAEYGDDFVIYVPHSSSENAKCTYITTKKIGKNNPFICEYSICRVESSLILESMGFKTGCGSLNGKVYSYQASGYGERGPYPAMEAVAKQRNALVAEVNDKIKELAKTSVDSLHQNEDYKFLDKEIEKLTEELRKLEEQRIGLNHQKDVLCRSVSSQFEKQAAELLVDLPKKTGCGVFELDVVRTIDAWADAKQRMNNAS